VSDEPYRTSDRRVIPALILGLVALFGAVYVAGYFFTSDRIPRGTTVSGIDIGGLMPVAAETRLRSGLAQRAGDPVRVVANGEPASIDPASAGLAVDVPASVAQSGGGRSWEPGRMWDYFAGGSDEDAVLRGDRDALDRAVAEVADEVDVPAVEGSVTFAGGEADAKYPEKGTVVDRAAAADVVADAFLDGGDPVELPTVEAEPQVSKDAVSRAMEDFANPAMSASVVVALAGEGVQLQPEDFAPALSMKPVDGELQPELDGAVLVAALTPRMRTIARSPKDASFTIVRGVPRVVPARVGVTFDPADVTGRFLDVLTRTGADRRLDVTSVRAQPDFTTEAANALGVKERVSSFTTNFPYASYRNQNLGRAAQLVDGSLLKPGETFSLNDTVGERTASNGFTKGFIISDGVFKEDFGGGVSQVATTTFNAAFFAGLEDVEHKPHSFYIDRYPVGREATVAWGAVDLRFKNTTPYGVYIRASVDPSSPSSQGAMHVSMYSTKYWDIKAEQSARYNETSPETRQLSGPECVPNTGYGGFDVDVYRLFYKAGSSKLDRRETMHTRYTPSDSVVCS
jgi:vancomycin resistance protein YoaR